MKEFIIGKNDCGQRLDRFLTKQNLPVSAIRKALRKKDIKVNSKREKAEYKLILGDVVRVFIKDEFFSDKSANGKNRAFEKFHGVSSKINIVYEDENIILADKPVGLLCHEGSLGKSPSKGVQNTLIEQIKAYLYRKGEYVPENEHSFEPALCNRIDRNTAGIVIAAKNAESLRVMNEKIKLRQIKKLYLCILSAVPEKREATLTAFLEKDEVSNTVRVSGKKNEFNKTIVTKYRVLDERGGLALAQVDLVTGRTHQIRAHMAYIGCPLLGDGKYGRNKVNKQYDFVGNKQALCSYKVRFDFDGENGFLGYLKGREFEIERVWFLDGYYGL